VILAVPADVTHENIAKPSALESWLLSEVRYFDSTVVLHGDESVLPPEGMRRNYNFQRSDELEGEFQLSGVMGRILGDGTHLDPEPIVTLNPQREFSDERVRRVWRHHVMDVWHLAIMSELFPSIQARGHLWYAGEWVTFAGHWPTIETGMRAA
jgi:predicted NAD/FAD-binding protein